MMDDSAWLTQKTTNSPNDPLLTAAQQQSPHHTHRK